TGDGFFRLSKQSAQVNSDGSTTAVLDLAYTRAGAFSTTPPTATDTKSYIVNSMGQNLTGYSVEITDIIPTQNATFDLILDSNAALSGLGIDFNITLD